MFLKDLNKFNSDFLDGKHASNSAGSVPILDSNAKLPLAQIPTGSTKNTVSLGNHTHAYAGSSSVGGAATSALKCTGNSATATTLETARTINGTSFNGSANITTSNWGTSRTLTIGNKGKSVNGSGNVSWSLSEIGALPIAGGTMTGAITMPNSNNGKILETKSDGTVVDGLYMTSSNNLRLGNTTTPLYFYSSDNPKIKVGDGTSQTLYHTGNKPTAADIGAFSINGGTLKGHLYMSPEKDIITANNYGMSGYLTDGTNHDYLLLMDSNNNVHIGWNNRKVVLDCDYPVQRQDCKLYHEGYKPTSIDYIDSRSVNHAPLSMPNGVSLHLKQSGVDGIEEGFYHPVLELKPWNDISGGPFAQIAITQVGRMWYRESTTDANNWNSWHKVYSTKDMPVPGNWWTDGAVIVKPDGVSEVGKYIDWHETNESTADYDARLSCSNGVICCNNAIQARGLLSTETNSGSNQANVCFLDGRNKLIFAQNGMFLFYSNDNGTQYWNMVGGYNTYSRLGSPDYRFKECYLEANPNVSSDRVLKENINYIRNNDTSTASTFSLMNLDEEDVNTNNSTDITYTDMYNFVRDDLELATFNYIKEPIEETNADTQDTENNETIDIDTSNKDFVDIKTDRNIIDFNITDRDVRLGFIAQDLLYNEDQTDNKVGQFIVTPASVEDGRTLEYNEGDYVNVLAGALKQAINEIEILKLRVEELEGGI